MSTNAIIGQITGKGLVRVYVHCAGDSLLPLLNKHYATNELATALVAGGYISELGKSIGTQHPFSLELRKRDEAYVSLETTYFHRDRGDSWESTQPMTFTRIQDGVDYWESDYYYFWDGSQWETFTTCEDKVLLNGVYQKWS